MTHLPECSTANAVCRKAWPTSHECIKCLCICDRLRACEQRVTTEALQQAKAREANGITWAQAYAASLRDAVEAVKRTVLVWDATDDYTYGLRDAVAVIEALGGKR